MKARFKKRIALGLAGIFSFVILIGCATKVNTLSRGGFTEPEPIRSSDRGSIAQFVSRVRPHRGNPDSHYLLACYYQESGDHRKALQEFDKALIIRPDFPQAYNRMGVSYDHLKDHSRAVDAYEKALRLNPQMGDALNNLGYSYLLQDRLDEAVSAFQKAIALNGQEGRFHNNLGLSYALQGRLDLAMVEFQLAGDEARAHHNIARFYHKRGWYGVARIHYSQALALDPSFIHARIALEAVDALAGIFQPAVEKTAEGKGPVPESDPAPGSNAERVAVSAPPVSSNPEAAGASVPGPDTNPLAGTAIERVSSGTGEDLLSLPTKPLNAETPPAGPISPQPKNKSVYRQRVGIEVSNGNGMNGMARKVSQHLKEKGLPVMRITNARDFSHPQTRIYFQNGYEEAAVRVADQLPGIQRVEERRRFDRPGINVKVIIGKDIHSDRDLKEGRS